MQITEQEARLLAEAKKLCRRVQAYRSAIGDTLPLQAITPLLEAGSRAADTQLSARDEGQQLTTVNVEPVAQVIDDLAADLRRRADELGRLAGSLRDTGDLDEAVAAVSVAVSTANLRLDLLLSRPIRELQRATTNGRPDADSLQP